MGAYSHTSIAEKMMCYAVVAEAFATDEGLTALDTFPKINTLIAIKLLNRRKRPASNTSVCILLKINRHSIRFKGFDEYVSGYIDAGLVRRGAGKGQYYYITEAGKAALDTLDTYLRRSTVKIVAKDKIMRKLPGPKKGQSMPNRWPAGQPKGRKPTKQISSQKTESPL